MDRLTPQRRSWNMSRIPARNTQIEKDVRSLLHRQGYRFSLHRRNLPGTPDIVLRKYLTVIFVHGCYWHRHRGCPLCTNPKTDISRWRAKFEANVSRDRRHARELRRLGWQVLIVWGCELNNPRQLERKLQKIPSGLNYRYKRGTRTKGRKQQRRFAGRAAEGQRSRPV